MEGRKLSGSYWRKRKLEKQEKEKKILESTPKLTNFFTRNKHNADTGGSSEPQPGASASNSKGENNTCFESEMETQEYDSEMEPQESVLPNNTSSDSIIGR